MIDYIKVFPTSSPPLHGPLLDVEGEDDKDDLLQPRKVSPTQAVCALSRQPRDPDATWIVVGGQS